PPQAPTPSGPSPWAEGRGKLVRTGGEFSRHHHLSTFHAQTAPPRRILVCWGRRSTRPGGAIMKSSRIQSRRPRPAAALQLTAACGVAVAAAPAAAQPTEPFPAVFDLDSLLPTRGGDGSLGFVVEESRWYGFAGESVAAAGDVNGDGIADMIIGSPGYYYYAYPGSYYPMTGRAYVIFGRDSRAGVQFPASMRPSGANGFRLEGEEFGGLREGAS